MPAERKIYRTGLRRWLAQRLLALLYGKGHDDGGLYFSHWKHASVGADAFLWHNGAFLLVRRKGVHKAGLYCLPGGNVDMENAETLTQGLVREVREETGLATHEAQYTLAYSLLKYADNPFQENRASVVLTYQTTLGDDQNDPAHETAETAGFEWATPARFEELAAQHKLAFDFQVEAIRHILQARP